MLFILGSKQGPGFTLSLSLGPMCGVPGTVTLSCNATLRGCVTVDDLGVTGLFSPGFPAILRPVVAKVYIVSFRTHDDRRPSKFIVLADNMRSAIKMAWEHGGADFQSRFDKSTAQAARGAHGSPTCFLVPRRSSPFSPREKMKAIKNFIDPIASPPGKYALGAAL
jgi:hypothetical protein